MGRKVRKNLTDTPTRRPRERSDPLEGLSAGLGKIFRISRRGAWELIMGNPKSHTKAKAGSALRASATGAHAATLLIHLAYNLPANNPWKPWLVSLAHYVSVALLAFAAWSAWDVRGWFRDKQCQRLISRTKSTLEAALNYPHTSAKHKNRLRRQLESLELLSVRAKLRRIRSLM
jgi:hypothetical protein